MFKTPATTVRNASAARQAGTDATEVPCRAGRTGKVQSLTLNDIRLLASLKWQAAGKPDGDGTRFWLEAEEELLQGR